MKVQEKNTPPEYRHSVIYKILANETQNIKKEWYIFLNFILFLNFTILYWFCHISKWICHRYKRVPHPEPSSLLPPHTLLLGHPSAPALINLTFPGWGFLILTSQLLEWQDLASTNTWATSQLCDLEYNVLCNLPEDLFSYLQNGNKVTHALVLLTKWDKSLWKCFVSGSTKFCTEIIFFKSSPFNIRQKKLNEKHNASW